MNAKANKEDNLIALLLGKFLPYWPLFVVLLIISVGCATVYVHYATPLYQASASILIKDEKKGSDESKLSESLDYLSSKKIVENEIEVLKSKSLMKEVVRTFDLYSSVFEEDGLKDKLLYERSPIRVEFQNIDTLTKARKVYFDFNETSNEVMIDGQRYPTDEWVTIHNELFKFNRNFPYKAHNRLYFTLTNPKAVVNQLTNGLNISSVSKLSSVISLSILDQSPVRAENILGGILEGYNKSLTDEKNILADNTKTFVEDRLKEVKQDLDSIEQRIQQYKSNNGALDISSQGQLFLESVSLNDQKLSEINMQLAALKHLQQYLVSDYSGNGIVPSTLGIEDPLLSQLLAKLYDAELEYEKLKETTAENNPILLKIKDEINKLKPSILRNIESQNSSLQARKANLQATIGSYSGVMEEIPQKERDLVDISREHSTKSSIYNFLLQKLEETALSYSSGTLNNKIVEEPESSPGPVSPNKKLIYLFSIVFSLTAGAILILGKDLVNRKILYRHQIESLTTFPIIGEIAYEKAKSPVVVSDGSRTLIAEQFRKLRATLTSIGMHGSKKKILITSTIPGDGKSFIAVNLSLIIAMGGKKVVLLELDLTNPTLSRKLNIANKVGGIASFLRGETDAKDIIKSTRAHKGLFIIPSGDLPENPSELILNGKIQELFAYLEDKFDYIIVDSAPVGALSDAYVLSPLCDSTLYVVRHNHTPKAALQWLDKNNKINELKNLRILFNGVQSRGFGKNDYGYGYGYTTGYSSNRKAYKFR